MEWVRQIEVPNVYLLKSAGGLLDRESSVQQVLYLYTQMNYEYFNTIYSDWLILAVLAELLILIRGKWLISWISGWLFGWLVGWWVGYRSGCCIHRSRWPVWWHVCGYTAYIILVTLITAAVFTGSAAKTSFSCECLLVFIAVTCGVSLVECDALWLCRKLSDFRRTRWLHPQGCWSHQTSETSSF
jgi:hypothetical protein